MEPIKTKSLSSQAKDAILVYIKNLNISENNKLPSEENLAKILGVSRITIRTALNELSSEGILFRRHGKGTFVNTEAIKLKTSLNPAHELTDIIKANGFTPKIKILSCKKISPTELIYNGLQLEKNDYVVELRKVFYANDKPCAYSIDYVPYTIFTEDSQFEMLSNSYVPIYKFLKDNYNQIIEWDNVHITTTTNASNSTLNEIFNCKDSIKSFLVLEGINYTNNDSPIFVSIEYIDTSFISFNEIRKKNMYSY